MMNDFVLRRILSLFCFSGLACLLLCGCAERRDVDLPEQAVLAAPESVVRPCDARDVEASQEDGGAEGGAYRLAKGDVLEIRSFYHEEINQRVTVRPDGCIALLLIPEERVEGLTVKELQEQLAGEYAKALRDPKIAVILLESVGQRVYVGGEVKTPGVLTLQGRLTCIQALAQSGGLTRDAYVENVVILRYKGGKQPEFIKLDLRNDLEHPEKGMRDIELRAYDIVLVPRTRISKFNQIVEQYIEKMIPIQRSFGLTYELSKTAVGL